VACYRLLVRPAAEAAARAGPVGRRCVAGRPVSPLPSAFLGWCCPAVAAAGQTALLLVGDNAPGHPSHAVRAGIRAHTRQVKATRAGVRVLPCSLPIAGPWRNPIGPKGIPTKRQVVEAARLLPTAELTERVYAAFGQPHEDHLAIPEKVA
jgi:hypothetical protein